MKYSRVRIGVKIVTPKKGLARLGFNRCRVTHLEIILPIDKNYRQHKLSLSVKCPKYHLLKWFIDGKQSFTKNNKANTQSQLKN